MMTAPIFTPSIRLSGRKRPGMFDVRIETDCQRVDLRAILFDAIAATLERLEPDQRIWQVEFRINASYGLRKSKDVVSIKVPGREFMDMAHDGIDELSRALCMVFERLDFANHRLEQEARAATQQASRITPSGNALPNLDIVMRVVMQDHTGLAKSLAEIMNKVKRAQ